MFFPNPLQSPAPLGSLRERALHSVQGPSRGIRPAAPHPPGGGSTRRLLLPLASPPPSLRLPGFPLGTPPCALGLHFSWSPLSPFLPFSLRPFLFFSGGLRLCAPFSGSPVASTAPSLASRSEGPPEAPDVLEPRPCGSAGSGCETRIQQFAAGPISPGLRRTAPRFPQGPQGPPLAPASQTLPSTALRGPFIMRRL